MLQYALAKLYQPYRRQSDIAQQLLRAAIDTHVR